MLRQRRISHTVATAICLPRTLVLLRTASMPPGPRSTVEFRAPWRPAHVPQQGPKDQAIGCQYGCQPTPAPQNRSPRGSASPCLEDLYPLLALHPRRPTPAQLLT